MGYLPPKDDDDDVYIHSTPLRLFVLPCHAVITTVAAYLSSLNRDVIRIKRAVGSSSVGRACTSCAEAVSLLHQPRVRGPLLHVIPSL